MSHISPVQLLNFPEAGRPAKHSQRCSSCSGRGRDMLATARTQQMEILNGPQNNAVLWGVKYRWVRKTRLVAYNLGLTEEASISLHHE